MRPRAPVLLALALLAATAAAPGAVAPRERVESLLVDGGFERGGADFPGRGSGFLLSSSEPRTGERALYVGGRDDAPSSRLEGALLRAWDGETYALAGHVKPLHPPTGARLGLEIAFLGKGGDPIAVVVADADLAYPAPYRQVAVDHVAPAGTEWVRVAIVAEGRAVDALLDDLDLRGPVRYANEGDDAPPPPGDAWRDALPEPRDPDARAVGDDAPRSSSEGRPPLSGLAVIGAFAAGLVVLVAIFALVARGRDRSL